MEVNRFWGCRGKYVNKYIEWMAPLEKKIKISFKPIQELAEEANEASLGRPSFCLLNPEKGPCHFFKKRWKNKLDQGSIKSSLRHGLLIDLLKGTVLHFPPIILSPAFGQLCTEIVYPGPGFWHFVNGSTSTTSLVHWWCSPRTGWTTQSPESLVRARVYAHLQLTMRF